MKSLLFLLAVVAVSSAAHLPKELGQKVLAQLFDLSALQSDVSPEVADNEVLQKFEAIKEDYPQIEDPSELGWILNSEGKKAVRKVIDTMPCGWPDSGIPPLAPYRREELTLEIKKSVIETLTKLLRFRVDGLDKMVITKLKITYWLSQKVTFFFTFPEIKISGKYATDTFANFMEEYGISVRYDGNGDFELLLENLTFSGSFKYKMPFIFGSIKIYKWKSVLRLGNCVSNINGLLGNGRLNNMVNEKIEETVMWAINDHQDSISAKTEEIIVPTANEQLKGNKIWDVIFGSSSPSTCVPPPDPWA